MRLKKFWTIIVKHMEHGQNRNGNIRNAITRIQTSTCLCIKNLLIRSNETRKTLWLNYQIHTNCNKYWTKQTDWNWFNFIFNRYNQLHPEMSTSSVCEIRQWAYILLNQVSNVPSAICRLPCLWCCKSAKRGQSIWKLLES